MEKNSTRCLSSLLHSVALPRNGTSDGVPSNLHLSRMVFQSPSNCLVWLKYVKRPVLSQSQRAGVAHRFCHSSAKFPRAAGILARCGGIASFTLICTGIAGSLEKQREGKKTWGLSIQNFNMKVYKDTGGPRRSDKRNCSRQQLSTSFSPFFLDYWGFLANEGLEPRSHY
jgi:hypothetical protein